MWIESHQDLGSHPKTRRLARTLEISRPTAVGILHFIWWWAVDYAGDGDISRYEAADIADACLWEESPDALVDALVDAGFLDRDGARLTIHDWHVYAGRLISQRAKNAERMRVAREQERIRREEARALHVPSTLSARVGLPDLTGPDLTGPENVLRATPAAAVALAPNGAVKAAARKEREPTEHGQFWEAFVAAIGTRPSAKPELAKWGNGVTAIRTAGVTLEEIPEIVATYRRRCPTMPCNPLAIANHLSDYRGAATMRGPTYESMADADARIAREHAELEQSKGGKGWSPTPSSTRPHSAPTATNGRSSAPT